jgi:hypothetical protein
MTIPLSPAAQAVSNAAKSSLDWEAGYLPNAVAAAALRAVAEHCVPDDSEGHWVYIPHVIAIAAELEGTNG